MPLPILLSVHHLAPDRPFGEGGSYFFSDLWKKNEYRSSVSFVFKHTFCFDKLRCFVYRKVLTAYIYFLKDRT